MSFLMAEMLGLELNANRLSLTEIDVSDVQTETSVFFTQDAMKDFARKVANKQRNKELEIITVHLEHVLERITNMLSDIGISPELPEAQLNPEEKWGGNTFAFKPPTACLVTNPDNDGPNAKGKNKINGLMDMFQMSAGTRDELLVELIDWLTIAQGSLESENARFSDRVIAKQDKDEIESHDGAQDALQRTVSALKKLNVIGAAIFGEKVETDIPKGNYSDRLGSQLNKNVRRASVALDSIPKTVRVNAMKNIFITGDLPEDLHSLNADLDENDEDEQKLLVDIAKHWKDVGEEVRDIMIDVHELKMIKRSTRLSVRRGLYLFKLIMALVTSRTNEIKAKETLIFKIKAEMSAIKHKHDHLHKEAKNWRERFNEKNSECDFLKNDKLDLKAQLEKHFETLKEKEDEITKYRLKINELEAEKLKSKENFPEGFDLKEAEETKERVLTLKAITRKHVSTIEKLEKELEVVLSNQYDLIEKEKLATFSAKEHANACEDSMNDMKMKLKATELRFTSLEELIETKNDEELRINHQLESVLAELKSKEDLIARLISSNDDEVEPSELLKKRKGSIMRKSRRESVPKKKSSKTLPIVPVIKTSIEDEEEGETRLEIDSLQPGNKLSPRRSQGLMIVESNILLPKRSRSRLAFSPIALVEAKHNHLNQTSVPNTLVPEEPNTDHNQLTPSPPVRRQSVATSAMLQRRVSVNVVSSKEYKRVVAELKASENTRNDLENEIGLMQQELENQEKKSRALKESSKRQHRLEKLIEEDKLKSDTSKVYTEALKVEGMINKFKMELSHLFEKALFSTASKQAKNAYNFSAPSNPKDFVTSIKLANQRLREGFNKLFESVGCMVCTVQQTHYKNMERAENSMGEMTSKHIKSLAKKFGEIESLERKLENQIESYNKLKKKFVTIAKLNQALVEETNEAIKRKESADIQLQHYQEEQINLGRNKSETTQTKQELEVLLTNAKTSFSCLKQQYDYLESMHEKEKCRREKLEKSLLQKNNFQAPGFGNDVIGISTKSKPVKYIQKGPKTIAGRYVKSLNQISNLSKDLFQKRVGFHMLKKVNKVTNMWSEAISLRLCDLVKKYLMHTRLNEIQKSFVAQVQDPDKNEDENDLATDNNIEKFQKILWKLEMFKRKATVTKPAFGDQHTIAKSREILMNVFREVAYSVIAIKNKGNNTIIEFNVSDKEDVNKKECSQLAPVAPKNSMDSIAINKNENQSEDIDKQVDPNTYVESKLAKHSELLDDTKISAFKTAEHRNNDAIIIKVETGISQNQLQDSNYQLKNSSKTMLDSDNNSRKIEIPSDFCIQDGSKLVEHNYNFFSRRNSKDKRRMSTLPNKDMYYNLSNHRIASIRDNNIRRGSMLDDCDDNVIKWNRRTSICPSRSVRRKSIHSETPQMPVTLEMDIRTDLRSVRQNLRAAMRRYSQSQDKNCMLADKLSNQALQKRHSTDQEHISEYLGTNCANNTNVSHVTPEAIIDSYKKLHRDALSPNDKEDTLEELIVESHAAQMDDRTAPISRSSSIGRLRKNPSSHLNLPVSDLSLRTENNLKPSVLKREIFTGTDHKVSI